MFRLAIFGLLAALLASSNTMADEVKGTVKTVDKVNNKITITVDGKTTTYPVGKDASFVSVSTVPGKKGKSTEKVDPIDAGLTGIKAGASVTVLVDKIDEKDTVTSVKVSGSGSSDKNSATTPKKKKKKT